MPLLNFNVVIIIQISCNFKPTVVDKKAHQINHLALKPLMSKFFIKSILNYSIYRYKLL